MSSESEQTAADLADLTLDDFKTWTTVNLKAFLHLRGKNFEGGGLVKSGWIGEVKGIQNWPSIFYMDIAYLLSLTQPDFIKRLESEYK